MRGKRQKKRHKKRHHTLTWVVHWKICKVYDLPHTSKWYERNRNNNKVFIVETAVPGDGNVESKEKEKQEEYQDLARETSRLWRAKTKVIPVVVEALGVIPKNLEGHLKEIGIPNRVRTLQSLRFLERPPS